MVVNVSIGKLADFLSQRLFSVGAVYVNDNDIKFVTVRTPKLQKTFIIYIPNKYKMVNENTHPVIHILETRSPLTLARHFEYLSKIKSTFTDSDLVSISADWICLVKNDGSTSGFKMRDGDSDQMEATADVESVSRSDILIANATEVFGDVGEELVVNEMAPPRDVEPTNEDPTQGDDSTLEAELTEPIELEFQDSDGGAIETITEFIGSEREPVKKIRVAPRESKGCDETPLIETLRVIHFSIDLNSLYKHIDSLEDRVKSGGDVIDENENDLRDGRVSRIEELATTLVAKIKTSHSQFVDAEMELKTQLSKLTQVFDQTASLKEKIESQPSKYVDAKASVEKVYTQTRITIRDLSTELIKIKDEFDDLLDVAESTLANLVAL